MLLIHRVWAVVLIGTHFLRGWYSYPVVQPVISTELEELRAEAVVAASLLRRSNKALDQCLISQSFVTEIGRVVSLICIQTTVVFIGWRLRKLWLSHRLQQVKQLLQAVDTDSEFGSVCGVEPESEVSSPKALSEASERKGPTTPSSLRRRK